MKDKVIFESTKRITQKFSKTHLAVDLGFRNQDSQNIVYAHSKGIIIELVDGKDNNKSAKNIESYGNYILIDHNNGFKTRYAHLKKNSIMIKKGQEVNENTPLAIIGDSGNAYGRHLHFEIFQNGSRIDPTPYLNKKFNQNTTNNITYQSYDLVKKKWLPNVQINTINYAGNFGHPISGVYIDILEYEVHDLIKNKWLPKVKGREDYAGNLSNPIDGIRIKGAIYRAKLKDGNWLPWVYKADDTPEGYAGIYGKEIDAIQIK